MPVLFTISAAFYTGSPLYCFHVPIPLHGFMLQKDEYIVFANGGVQEALVNKANLSLFIMFGTLKHPQSLRLRIYIKAQ